MPQNFVIDLSEQTLLYVRGKRGTGKTEVIKAFLFSIELLDISNQVLLCALTGAAASYIKGSILHTALRINRDQNDSARMSKGTAQRKIALRHKRVLIVDKIGIVSKRQLHRVNQQYKILFNLPISSGAMFDGLPVIVALSDFY